MKRNIFLSGVMVLMLCACSPALRYLTDKDKIIKLPQVLARIEPVLEEESILITGSLIIQNPNESDLEFDKLYISFLDGNNTLLANQELTLARSHISPKSEVVSNINLRLGLNVLEGSLIKVALKTVVYHKSLGFRVPLDNIVAILDLNSLKRGLIHPLDVRAYTKIYSNRLGSVSVDYAFDIVNPFSVNLLLESGQIIIYAEEKRPFSRIDIKPVLLKAQKSSRINGSIQLQKIIGKILIAEFIKQHPLHLRFSGNLKIPNTNIVAPLTVEATQEFDFSLFK